MDMSKYKALFIEESREHLAELSRLLVELETAGGEPLSEKQAIQFMLADMATDLEAARLLGLKAASCRANGEGLTLAAAKAIGKVTVDHGQTSCRTPDAAAYIAKTLAYRAKKKRARA